MLANSTCATDASPGTFSSKNPAGVLPYTRRVRERGRERESLSERPATAATELQQSCLQQLQRPAVYQARVREREKERERERENESENECVCERETETETERERERERRRERPGI
jgi:hypothetical protein